MLFLYISLHYAFVKLAAEFGVDFARELLNFGPMHRPQYRIRRATLDDLGPLHVLWGLMHYPADELARRVTEFQVATAEDGALVGALGLRLAERQGLMHSEACTDFALADHLRPLLWERIQAVAANQGLLRLWTLEAAPFWSRCGLLRATEEVLGELPTAWREASGQWLTLKLRDDLDTIIKADKEFAVFMELERQKTARALRRGKMLHAFALFLAFLLVVFAMVAAGYVFLKRQQAGAP